MNISSHPITGLRLPDDWRSKAQKRCQDAESDYIHALENKWRNNLTTTNNSAIYEARLRSDAYEERSDAMRKTVDNDTEEIWENNGIRIIKRKQNS